MIIKTIWQLIKKTGSEFSKDNGMKLSASLAYYTIFSIAPLLIIVMSLAGLFYGTDAVQGKVYLQLRQIINEDAALQIQNMIKSSNRNNETTFGSIIGIVLLFLGSSGVFLEIQDSINYIWSIKAKPKKNWMKFINNRLISFSLIIGMGFVLMVSLMVNTLVDAFIGRLDNYFSETTIYITYILNIVLVIGVTTLLFAIIFKVLPDAKIKWKDAFIGAGVTSFLFLIGRFIIGAYIANTSVSITYGAASAIIIILVWVYYSSVILFLGAEFTKIYTTTYGGGFKPDETAVYIVKEEVKEIDYIKRKSDPGSIPK